MKHLTLVAAIGATVFYYYFAAKIVTSWLFSPRFGRYFGLAIGLLVAALTFTNL